MFGCLDDLDSLHQLNSKEICVILLARKGRRPGEWKVPSMGVGIWRQYCVQGGELIPEIYVSITGKS